MRATVLSETQRVQSLEKVGVPVLRQQIDSLVCGYFLVEYIKLNFTDSSSFAPFFRERRDNK